MKRGDHGGNAELPFVAEPDVKTDQQYRQQRGNEAVAQQVVADLRTDELGAADLEAGLEDRLDRRDRLLLGRAAARLLLNPDEHVVGVPEVLQRDVVEVQDGQLRTQGGEVDGFVRSRLDQDAADEVQPQIEAQDPQRHQRGESQDDGESEGEPSPVHEADVGVIRNEPQRTHDFVPLERA